MKFVFIVIAILVAIQFIPVKRDNPPFDRLSEVKASTEIHQILKRSCYDCHSYETRYSTISKIAPFSWKVRSNITNARAALNFSIWGEIPQETLKARMERLPAMLNMNFMPKPSYLLFHSDAKLTEEDKRKLVQWSKEVLNKM